MKSALVLMLLAVGCSHDGTQSPARCTTCSTTDAIAPRPLCDLCTADTDCDTGICREYGDGYRKCSTTCTVNEPAAQCAGPAQNGCNNMGYCTCPRYEPPMDAGSSDQRDAAQAP